MVSGEVAATAFHEVVKPKDKVYVKCYNVVYKFLLVLTDFGCSGFCYVCNGKP
jgi:hypothetical protein